MFNNRLKHPVDDAAVNNELQPNGSVNAFSVYQFDCTAICFGFILLIIHKTRTVLAINDDLIPIQIFCLQNSRIDQLIIVRPRR